MRATNVALLFGTCGLLLVACGDTEALPVKAGDGGTNADATGGSPGRGGNGGTGGATGQGGEGGDTTGQGGGGGGDPTGAGGGMAGAGGSSTTGSGGVVGTGSGGQGGVATGMGGMAGGGSGGQGGTGGGGVGSSCGGFRPAPVPGCKAGLFCELKPDTCNIIADVPGTCAEAPQACDLIYAPVCGCDGKTYGNDCARKAAKVSRANTGPCMTTQPPGGVGKVCGGLLGSRCAQGLFCEIPGGSCGAADQTGTCQAVPVGCTKELAPVCGCDGKTYGNDCMRRAAGVSKQANGAC